MTPAKFTSNEELGHSKLEYKLSMSIGIALDIQKVLDPFLRTAQRLLGLRSIYFFYQQQGLETGPVSQQATTLTIPPVIGFPAVSMPRICKEIAAAVFANNDDTAERYHGDTHYLAIRLPAVGCIVLATPATASATTELSLDYKFLLPVCARLARSCQACIEHQRVLDRATLAHQAGHDALTDLPNRRTLQLRLRQAVAAALRHGHFDAVFFINTDRFKAINDSLGHSAGDAVLVALSQRLQSAARDEDALARVGGDEFILVASNLGTVSSRQRASRKRSRLDWPPIAGSRLMCTARACTYRPA